MSDAVPVLVEHLFRNESGKMLSNLARRFGAANFDLVEEAVQDALIRALKTWPYQGVPPNPAAWLARVANNLALDKLRRQATLGRIQAELTAQADEAQTEDSEREALDDQLAMMFACCHPSINFESRIALTLKSVCGFGTAEIARAFVAEETAIAQRIVRAKRFLKDNSVAITIPPDDELSERLDSVLRVLYLLFNEGYSASVGDELIRHDLCQEALRLGRLLTQLPQTAQPKVHALVALMFFHGSRLPARVNGAGDLLRLCDQDRDKWDWRLIYAGLRHLEKAAEGDEVSSYHHEAGIAAIHAQCPSDESTNWPAVLWHYDRLMELAPSPIVELNRAVAVMRVHGPESGLHAIQRLANSLGNFYLYHSVRGDFEKRCGRIEKARAAFRQALRCPCCEPERRFITARLAECGD